MKIGLHAIGTSLPIILIVAGITIFLPAETFNYWQAWAFIAVFTIAMSILTIYVGIKSPAALQRRMQVGPAVETRTEQKLLSTGVLLSMPVILAFSAFDHRFHWSPVPIAVSLVGDALVVIGGIIVMFVILQNSYAATTITVEAGQKVSSTGLYRFIRHPMYGGFLITMMGTPLALGSWWGLACLIFGVITFALRILDEEKALKQGLHGYSEYMQKVHYRLVPYVW
jgi:protein-S-isoprenylcysteine O-methyltransferase Ste14